VARTSFFLVLCLVELISHLGAEVEGTSS